MMAVIAVIGAGLALSACRTSTEGTAAAYEDDAPAGDLYNKGLAYMNAGDLTAAVKAFNEVDRESFERRNERGGKPRQVGHGNDGRHGAGRTASASTTPGRPLRCARTGRAKSGTRPGAER